jgi:PhzF family phenazine biosynthesis protein
MSLSFHQVDAFSERPFAGNPAVVYRLDQWLPEARMQQIAAEHNLAETAFLVREGSAWHIRWFTPATEVPLCGHATLASAKVLFDVYGEPGECLEFVCQSGPLQVRRLGERLELDLPAHSAGPMEAPRDLAKILGLTAREVLTSQDNLLVVVGSEAQVRACRPNLAELARLPWQGVIVTAQGDRHDFVSRYFAPAIGIDEDPVTGAAHCLLIPYWAARLGRDELLAFQCSARGGELHCRAAGRRVRIAGHATLVASGELFAD